MIFRVDKYKYKDCEKRWSSSEAGLNKRKCGIEVRVIRAERALKVLKRLECESVNEGVHDPSSVLGRFQG